MGDESLVTEPALTALRPGRRVARQLHRNPALAPTPPPFSTFEWMIAWRYLRASRADGGVSVMTWISLIGITLAVFALIATLAVRSGFRAEFVGTILGANAHVTIYTIGDVAANGRPVRTRRTMPPADHPSAPRPA
jgi:hypothetical protein